MDEIKAVWYESFYPRHSEVDGNGFVKIKSILDYLQEAAANHADNLGCGMRYLLANNKMWVLSRIKLHFSDKLKLGDKFTVKTYPMNFKKLFAAREFAILDSQNKLIAAGSSFWLLIAADTMRPLRPAENLPPFPDNSNQPEFYREIDKINADDDLRDKHTVFCSCIHDSQIDLNHHLNNAEYAAMIHDALAEIIHHTPYFSELQINFIAATKSGEKLAVAAKIDQQNFEAAGFSGEQIKFQARGTLAE